MTVKYMWKTISAVQVDPEPTPVVPAVNLSESREERATQTTATVSWNKNPDAKGYFVYRKSGSKWKKVATIKNVNTTTYTNKKLKAGTNYTYKSYTTTQGLDGKAGSGKRFKVDSSKKLTQDLLDYAINKKEKETKKNLEERFEELGINTSNKLNEEEGFTEQISVNGKTYYVSEDDAERWNEEVSKYSDPDDETTSKYANENGNEYYIIILYVDWLYDESGNVSDDFSLYEDELSYVFDYKSIHKSDDTR